MQTTSDNDVCVHTSVWSDPQVYLLKIQEESKKHRSQGFTVFAPHTRNVYWCSSNSTNAYVLYVTAAVLMCFHSGVHLLLSRLLSPTRIPSPLALPIQTSPNWPLPSFLISWRDSRGISHISLVFTDKSASLGMPRLQLPIKRQHSPAALSESERERQTGRQKKRKQEEKKTAGAEIKEEQDRLLMRLCNWQLNRKLKAQGEIQHNRHKQTLWTAAACVDTKRQNRDTWVMLIKLSGGFWLSQTAKKKFSSSH